MSRYAFYPMVLCMLINTILFVPMILVEGKNRGTTLAILLAVGIGFVFMYTFMRSLNTEGNLDLPTLLARHLPTWLRAPILIFLAIMWYIAGMIVVAGFAVVSNKFIAPDFYIPVITAFFSLVICWCLLRPTESVFYLLEIIMVLNVPFIAIILFKALSNQYLDWYAMWDAVSDHPLSLPSWSQLSAATYIFTGYINMAILNRYLHFRLRPLMLAGVCLIGFAVLLSTFLIPIGFHGTVGVEHYIFVWITTADSLRMEFGFIERVIYVFILLYLNLSLMFAVLVWHIGLELIKNIHPRWNRPFVTYTVVALMFLCELGYTIFLNEKQSVAFARSWLNVRLVSELFVVALVAFLVKWRRSE